jgi:hypothetical protein
MKNVDPKAWGPSAWWLLHTAAAKASAQGERDAFLELARAYVHILPCASCRENYAEYLKTAPFPCTATALPGWAYKMHHNVNAHVHGDASKSPPRKLVLQVYSQPCNLKADIVERAAPFLATIETSHADSVAHFANALSVLFDVPKVPASLGTLSKIKKWLGITHYHVKAACAGTCMQKGGCDCDKSGYL